MNPSNLFNLWHNIMICLKFGNLLSLQQQASAIKFRLKMMPNLQYSSPHQAKSNTSLIIASGHGMATSDGGDAASFRQQIVSRSDLFGDLSTSFSIDTQLLGKYTQNRKELIQQIRCMLIDTETKPIESLDLINTLERLGVSYLFENEIEKQLGRIFTAKACFKGHYDLHTTAAHFRVFRQHGYNISSGVFNKFTDENGKFLKALNSDIKGLLSLYEAAHVRTHDEDILDEALAFTTAHLKSIVTTTDDHAIAKQVMHALDQPLHRGMPRIEARKYISFYEEDQSRNETLLMLGKLDFNILQLIYRWWNDLYSGSEMANYVRNRMASCYLWAVAVHFEPQYSLSRNILFKIISLTVIFDDTFDSYGTLEELQIFTDVIQRWDTSAIDQLSSYMKPCYKALMEIFEEIEDEMEKQGRSYAVNYVTDALKDIVIAYDIEAKMFNGGLCVPSFDDYINVAVKTCNYDVYAATAFMCMGELADIDAFKWIESEPKLLKASQTFCRLLDDVKDSEQTHTGIYYYMKEYGVSKQETVEEFRRRMENAWKDINGECLKPLPISLHLKMLFANLARIVEVTDKQCDGWFFPEIGLKDNILAILVDPIPI